MKTSVFLCSISLTLVTFGQNPKSYWDYYRISNQARDSFDAENYQEAGRLFDTAFSTVDIPLYSELEKAYLTQIKLNNHEKANEYVVLNAMLFGIPFSKRKNVSDSLYLSMKEVAQPYIDEKKKSFNTKFQNQIDSLFKVDQDFRKSGSLVYPNGLNLDSANTYYLLSLIDKHGFPTPTDVSLWHNSTVSIIFLHADFDSNNVLLGELLLKALEYGWFSPSNYACIIDRRMNFTGKEMYYYTAPFGYDDLSQNERNIVTERRNSIGLRSVEKSYTWTFNNKTLQVKSKD